MLKYFCPSIEMETRSCLIITWLVLGNPGGWHRFRAKQTEWTKIRREERARQQTTRGDEILPGLSESSRRQDRTCIFGTGCRQFFQILLCRSHFRFGDRQPFYWADLGDSSSSWDVELVITELLLSAAVQ